MKNTKRAISCPKYKYLLIWLANPSFLFVYVYLQGGEIVQETITSNVSEDIITLEFQRTDGTLVTELIDFRNVSTELSVGSMNDGGGNWQVLL